MTEGSAVIDAPRAAAAVRPPHAAPLVALAALAFALIGLCLLAPSAEAGMLAKAKRATKQEIRDQGKEPLKVSCRKKGKPDKPPGRYAKCRWASAGLLADASTTQTCRGESRLIGKRRRQRLRIEQTGCKVDNGATKNNEFMPDQLAKRGYEATSVFCFSNLVNGYRCRWEALNFRLNVTEDCFGKAKNIEKKVTIETRRCRVNEIATAAQTSVKRTLSDRGLDPGQVRCRPSGSIECDYRATRAFSGWTYHCAGDARLGQLADPPTVEPCELSAPDLAPLRSGNPRPQFGVNEAWQGMLGQVDALRGIGATTARMSVPWNNVESSRGSYSWTVADAAYNRLTGRGIRPVLVITGAPCWATQGQSCGFIFPPAESKLGEWGRFAGAVARRYPQALAIEVWNEANTSKFFAGGPDPDLYAKILERAYDGIKAARPQTTVLSTGLAAHAINEPGQSRYDDFLRAIYLRGAKQHSDAIAHHGYPGGGPSGDHRAGVRAQLADLKDVMLDFGDQDKEIWITESGVSTTASGNKAYSAAQQARVYADLYQVYRKVPGVPTAIFHRWRDLASGNGPESGFGLQRHDGSPKPALCALAEAAGAPC